MLSDTKLKTHQRDTVSQEDTITHTSIIPIKVMELRLLAAIRRGGERVDRMSVIARILQQRVFVIIYIA
jgi:hypothetical protein